MLDTKEIYSKIKSKTILIDRAMLMLKLDRIRFPKLLPNLKRELKFVN